MWWNRKKDGIICPKCQKGYLLAMPNDEDHLICEVCYLISTTEEVEKAIKTGYKDDRSEEMKALDAAIEVQNRKSPLFIRTIRQGKRIVQAIKQKEKEERRKQ